MTDVVDPATRSRMMSGIHATDTQPEMLIRRALHARGFRYRLHVATLPGTPDLVLPKYRAAILIHGCFWHGHNCPLFKWPKSNAAFWLKKINRNRDKDAEAMIALQRDNWRVLVIWECALKGKARRSEFPQVIDAVSNWLNDASASLHEISGPLTP